VGDNRSKQNEFTGHITKAYSIVRFPAPSYETRAQIESNATNYFLRQIDALIAIWNGGTPNASEAGAVARQAFDSGVPVVWISPAGEHAPRLIVDFDEEGNAAAPETDCTEGPLTLALCLIVGGPNAKVGRSGISPKEGLKDYYSESWRPRCYSTIYDFLRRVGFALASHRDWHPRIRRSMRRLGSIS
jgi:hypothetical protein